MRFYVFLSNNYKFRTDLFRSDMRSLQILPLWVRVDQEAMAMKGYSTLPRPPELETRHPMQFNVILKAL